MHGLLLGIILGCLLPGIQLWGCAAVALASWLALTQRHRPALVRTVLAMAIAYPLAAAWVAHRTPQEGPLDIARLAPLRNAVILAQIATDPVRKGDSWRFEAEVLALRLPYPATCDGRLWVRLDAVDPPGYGDCVALRGRLVRPPPARNPGEPSFKDMLARNGIYATLGAKSCVLVGPSQETGLMPLAIAAKHQALSVLARLPAREGELLASLLIGSAASGLDPEVENAFRSLGLAHLLAVSGTQIMLLLFVLLPVLDLTRLPGWLKGSLAMVCLVVYAMMTGLPPSIVRATLMGGFVILSHVTRRPTYRYLALETAIAVMLLAWPPWLFDLGFQFSVLASFALIHTAPLVRARLGILPLALAEPLAMATAATLWVSPLQIAVFGQFSPWSLLLNVVCCAMVATLTWVGAGAVACAAIGLGAAPLWLGAAWFLTWLLEHLALWGIMLPAASVFMPQPPWGWAAIAYALMAAAAWLISWGWRRRALALLGLVGLSYAVLVQQPPSRELAVYVLDVGQGDAIVLRTPGRRWFLIDGGPGWDGGDAGERVVVPFLRRQGVRTLEGIVLTHPHADHMAGSLSAIRTFPVHAVWDSGQSEGSELYEVWLRELLHRGIPLRRIHAGLSAELEAGVHLEVLGPPCPLLSGSRSDCNNNSVVMLLRYGRFRMLLPGDAEEEVERWLARTYASRLRASVLKVSHHGSRYGSVDEFLAQVRPRTSILSVGANNPFRHPASETLGRLRRYGPVYRTDLHGAIAVRTDGVSWTIQSAR